MKYVILLLTLFGVMLYIPPALSHTQATLDVVEESAPTIQIPKTIQGPKPNPADQKKFTLYFLELNKCQAGYAMISRLANTSGAFLKLGGVPTSVIASFIMMDAIATKRTQFIEELLSALSTVVTGEGYNGEAMKAQGVQRYRQRTTQLLNIYQQQALQNTGKAATYINILMNEEKQCKVLSQSVSRMLNYYETSDVVPQFTPKDFKKQRYFEIDRKIGDEPLFLIRNKLTF